MATPTYWNYLRLRDLLELQGGLEENESALPPDELHFIVVHQVFELWFKLILKELREARDHLLGSNVPEESIPYVVHHIHRVNCILDHAVAQFTVVETLDPQDFLNFRDKLIPASGMQSFQFREIEILLGVEEEESANFAKALAPIEHAAKQTAEGAWAWERIERARKEISLRHAVNEWLFRTPIDGSVPSSRNKASDIQRVQRFLDDYVEAHLRSQDHLAKHVSATDSISPGARLEGSSRAEEFVRAKDIIEGLRETAKRRRAALLFIESYRELPLLAWPRQLLDELVSLEEKWLLWRTRHARMVERIIGRRLGTGGESVTYLDSRNMRNWRIFRELWEVRDLLVARRDLPDLQHRDAYSFRPARAVRNRKLAPANPNHLEGNS